MLTVNQEINTRLQTIRRDMSTALGRKDMAEYKRLGAAHRELLHAQRSDLKAAWERCKMGAA